MSLSLALALALAAPLLAGGSSPTCPAGVRTACGAAQTCCPVLFSATDFGCCPLAGAVCCGGQECCPAGHACVNTSAYSAVCVPADGSANVSATQVCGPGPARAASSSAPLPSLVVNGDSVSIGQMGDLVALLAGKALVQHSPDAGGGGADDVGNGVRCAENFWRDAMFDAAPAASNWTLLSFNFGLHNLDNATAAEAQYAALLAQYADSLLARVPASRLLYVTTTPQMQFRVHGNTVVEDLNALALPIMAARAIEVADLYSHVTAFCGAVYSNCSLCDDEYSPQTNVTCGYHYSPAGWQYLASFMAPIYERKLAAISAAEAAEAP